MYMYIDAAYGFAVSDLESAYEFLFKDCWNQGIQSAYEFLFKECPIQGLCAEEKIPIHEVCTCIYNIRIEWVLNV
jgi:hypothetical protein